LISKRPGECVDVDVIDQASTLSNGLCRERPGLPVVAPDRQRIDQ
jgi:hypothetical protein